MAERETGTAKCFNSQKGFSIAIGITMVVALMSNSSFATAQVNESLQTPTQAVRWESPDFPAKTLI